MRRDLRSDGSLGSSTDATVLSADAIAKHLSELERRIWRIGLEVRAAGQFPVRRGRDTTTFLEVYDDLPARQREIVSLLVAGYRIGEIARRLFLAQGTVRNHLSALYRRFGVHSQVELLSLLRWTEVPEI